MTAIAFAFGNHPGITGHEAIDIAEGLRSHLTLGSFELAEKIRSQAERDVMAFEGRASDDLELGPREMIELLKVLDERSAPLETDAVIQLREELRVALDQV